MSLVRVRLNVRGAVQGVGFRPLVYRLARDLGLAGWVLNSPEGVSIEIEGDGDTVNRFRSRLETEKPPAAVIAAIEQSFLIPERAAAFEIRDSLAAGDKKAWILPDLATCPDCLREIFDPGNRRFHYPFTNCANCGPRFSIVEALPYDRPNTTMRGFALCDDCALEYHNPDDRRFHAQPTACPRCGPRLEFWDASGSALLQSNDALRRAIQTVRDGQILALKGIGGFQLILDARNEAAVQTLRQRKRRPDKPFALLMSSLEHVRNYCRLSPLEGSLLLSPRAPIVLLEKIPHTASLAPNLAPGNPSLGVMLPCSPLHHLIMRELNSPVIATSGNLSDEPICTDENEAVARLGGIADGFLIHNRRIARPMDDSVVRVVADRELILRSARGCAPVCLETDSLSTTLAVGAHLKNAVALQTNGEIFLSQHIGDLETEEAFAAFRQATADLPRLYAAEPTCIACDLHPDYLSTKFARRLENQPSVLAVPHHYAHVMSCLADNRLEDRPALGICWDGSGDGGDGTAWGGEFLHLNHDAFIRAAHLRQFRLPGGEAAVRQPRRSALGLLYEIWGTETFSRDTPLLGHFNATERRMVARMLAREINSPRTSSAGRLFDGVAALLGLRQRSSFEGQAAMDLEFAIAPGVEERYPFDLEGSSPMIVSWQPMIARLLEELPLESVNVIAARFHNTLVEMIVAVARAVGETNIVLTGGCFQNRYLTERSVRRLREEGFQPWWHQRVPPNDGGIALGQIVAANRELSRAASANDRKESNVPGYSRQSA